MEKVRGELLVETVVNVLMPKVVPALIIGYIVWEQTNSAMIYQSISEYTMSSLSTVEPIKKDFEEIARAATEGGSEPSESEASPSGGLSVWSHFRHSKKSCNARLRRAITLP